MVELFESNNIGLTESLEDLNCTVDSNMQEEDKVIETGPRPKRMRLTERQKEMVEEDGCYLAEDSQTFDMRERISPDLTLESSSERCCLADSQIFDIREHVSPDFTVQSSSQQCETAPYMKDSRPDGRPEVLVGAASTLEQMKSQSNSNSSENRKEGSGMVADVTRFEEVASGSHTTLDKISQEQATVGTLNPFSPVTTSYIWVVLGTSGPTFSSAASNHDTSTSQPLTCRASLNAVRSALEPGTTEVLHYDSLRTPENNESIPRVRAEVPPSTFAVFLPTSPATPEQVAQISRAHGIPLSQPIKYRVCPIRKIKRRSEPNVSLPVPEKANANMLVSETSTHERDFHPEVSRHEAVRYNIEESVLSNSKKQLEQLPSDKRGNFVDLTEDISVEDSIASGVDENCTHGFEACTSAPLHNTVEELASPGFCSSVKEKQLTSSGILKKIGAWRQGSNTFSEKKGKRVHFGVLSEDPDTCRDPRQKLPKKYSRNVCRALFRTPEAENRSPVVNIQNTRLISPTDQLENAVFPPLASSRDAISQRILSKLAPPKMAAALRVFLTSQNITTVGHLARLPKDEVHLLPIRVPKLERLQQFLANYLSEQEKILSIIEKVKSQLQTLTDADNDQSSSTGEGRVVADPVTLNSSTDRIESNDCSGVEIADSSEILQNACAVDVDSMLQNGQPESCGKIHNVTDDVVLYSESEGTAVNSSHNEERQLTTDGCRIANYGDNKNDDSVSNVATTSAAVSSSLPMESLSESPHYIGTGTVSCNSSAEISSQTEREGRLSLHNVLDELWSNPVFISFLEGDTSKSPDKRLIGELCEIYRKMRLFSDEFKSIMDAVVNRIVELSSEK